MRLNNYGFNVRFAGYSSEYFATFLKSKVSVHQQQKNSPILIRYNNRKMMYLNLGSDDFRSNHFEYCPTENYWDDRIILNFETEYNLMADLIWDKLNQLAANYPHFWTHIAHDKMRIAREVK